MNKEVGESIKHVAHFFLPSNYGNPYDVNAESNPHNDTTISLGFVLNTSSTLSYVGKFCASDKTSHLSDCIKYSLVPSVLFQQSNYSTSLKKYCDKGNFTDNFIHR